MKKSTPFLTSKLKFTKLVGIEFVDPVYKTKNLFKNNILISAVAFHHKKSALTLLKKILKKISTDRSPNIFFKKNGNGYEQKTLMKHRDESIEFKGNDTNGIGCSNYSRNRREI